MTFASYFPEYTMVYRTVRNVAHQRARDGRAVSKYVGRGEQGKVRPWRDVGRSAR